MLGLDLLALGLSRTPSTDAWRDERDGRRTGTKRTRFILGYGIRHSRRSVIGHLEGALFSLDPCHGSASVNIWRIDLAAKGLVCSSIFQTGMGTETERL